MPDVLSEWELNELLRLDDLKRTRHEFASKFPCSQLTTAPDNENEGIETSAMMNKGIESLLNTLAYASESLSSGRQPIIAPQE
jgi:hypothetical protein